MKISVLWIRSYTVGLVALSSFYIHCGKVPMKVVDEPSSFGFQQNFEYNTHLSSLRMRVKPSNFSGPPHLKQLYGKCFSKTIDSYKYELCPFFNVTQHEQSLRWNPYSGVLGVWQEWFIHNNRFVAQEMRDGDSCGYIYRSVKVLLKCGDSNEIGNVTEPHTCHYEIELKTPLVCHPHSLLVYPTLTDQYRHEWDLIETRLANEEITPKGYNVSLQALFEKVGYRLSKDTLDELKEEANKEFEPEITDTEFYSIPQCSQEYKKVKEELEEAKKKIELYEKRINDLQHEQFQQQQELNEKTEHEEIQVEEFVDDDL